MFLKFGSILLECEHITAFIPSTGELKILMLNGTSFSTKDHVQLKEFFDVHASLVLNESE